MNNAIISHLAKKDVLLDLKIQYLKQQLSNSTTGNLQDQEQFGIRQSIETTLPVVQSTNSTLIPSSYVVVEQVPSYTRNESNVDSASTDSISGPFHRQSSLLSTDATPLTQVLPLTMSGSSVLPTVGTFLKLSETTSARSTVDRSLVSLVLNKRAH